MVRLRVFERDYNFRFRYALKCLIHFYVQKTSSISRINFFRTLFYSEFSIAPLKVSRHFDKEGPKNFHRTPQYYIENIFSQKKTHSKSNGRFHPTRLIRFRLVSVRFFCVLCPKHIFAVTRACKTLSSDKQCS